MVLLAADALLTGIASGAALASDFFFWQQVRTGVAALVPGTWLLFSLCYALGQLPEHRCALEVDTGGLFPDPGAAGRPLPGVLLCRRPSLGPLDVGVVPAAGPRGLCVQPRPHRRFDPGAHEPGAHLPPHDGAPALAGEVHDRGGGGPVCRTDLHRQPGRPLQSRQHGPLRHQCRRPDFRLFHPHGPRGGPHGADGARPLPLPQPAAQLLHGAAGGRTSSAWGSSRGWPRPGEGPGACP